MGLFGTLGKIAGGVGGFMVGGPAGAAAGYSLGSGLEKDAKANKLNKQAAGIAKQQYAETAPLRAAALQGALNLHPQRRDLSGLFSDPGNPYNRVNTSAPPPGDLSRVAVPAPPPVANKPAGANKPGGVMSNPIVQRLLANKTNSSGTMIGKNGLVRRPGEV